MVRRALIVGAGIGGLAAGVALRHAGWDVRIFERAASPRELGFALNLAPNAIAALRELGLADRVIAQGCVTTSTELRRADGSVITRLDLGSALTGPPSVVALRQVLHGALLEAADPASLALSSAAVGFQATDDGGVTLALQDGRSERGDILVGADGVRSIVRAQLHPGEPPPRRSRYLAVRGVAHGVLYHLGSLTAVAYLGRGVEAATIRAGGEVIYWYMSLLLEGVPAAEGARATVERCAGLLDRSFRAIVRATRAEDLRIEDLVDRAPLACWGDGPVTLLGDAAHPMLPHTGQGAAQALEDAVALGLALSQGTEVVAALRRYEQVRSRRTRALVQRGRRIAQFTTTKSRAIEILRSAIIRAAPARAMAAGFLLAGGADPHRPLRRPPAR